MDVCWLHSESTWSNLHMFLLKQYRNEWGIVRDTGRCPGRLFAAVLMIRCQMVFNTQDVEGFNSVVRAMGVFQGADFAY